MSSNWKAPPKLKEPYTSWKAELEIWQNFTEIEKKKQGAALFLSLPDPSSARDAVLELGAPVINSDTGVASIIAKLDTLFLKDENILTYQAWKNFIKFKRHSQMNMTDYSIEFSKLYNSCKIKKLTLPEGVLAIQYLESANLSEAQHRLALATCDKMEYESMKAQVLKITTDIATPQVSQIMEPSEIKIETSSFPAEFHYDNPETENDEIDYDGELPADTFYGNWRGNNTPYRPWGRGYSRGSSRGFPYRGSNNAPKPWVGQTPPPNNWRSTGKSSYNKQQNDNPQPNAGRSKQINPVDRYGRPRQCRECLSIHHLEEKCPETDNNIVLLTDEVLPTSTLLEETIGCMVVDSGCINTVCGDVWLDSYLESLSCKDKKSVAMENSSSWFRFGNGASFQSLKKVTIPVYLGSIRARISTDVVKYEIPLLFSKNSLKKGQGSINFSKDTIRILNQYLTLENTSTGHYILRLSRNPDSPVEELKDVLFSVNLDDMDQAKLRSTALKWHRQFAHPPAAKLINLLRRANIEHPDMVDTITKVTDSCNTCLRYRKPPHRPAVAFPLASRFNQTVAIDLKDIKPGIKIIHMVDHATRYGQACLVKNKSSSEIVKRIFELWIRVFGCPEQLLTDNGGEFNNKEYLDLCDKCNIKVLTTAAESPWSNGLVEKHNGILGHMVTKMLEDEPIDAELAIHWAVAAKNALTTVYGFSPNLLVFGRDPAMPNTMQNSIAANDPEFYSSIVRDNLNALHKARESFLHQEASEKLSRALSKQTRTYSDRSFLNNDEVFYKRDHSSRWQGPAKILGRDSNQVLIKHGGSYLRVHPCRLLSTNTPQEKVCVNKNNSPEEGPADASDECSSDDDGPSKSPEKGLVGASDESSSDDDGPSRSYHTPEDSIASQPQLEPSSEDEVYQEATPDQAPDSGHANFKDSSQASGKITPGKTLKHIPKKNQIINYRIIGENQTRKATCLGRGGKASTNSWHYINVHDHDSDTKRCLSVKDDMQSWEICNDTLIAIKTDIFAAAKQAELDKWKSMNVYTETEDTGQRRISTRWVCTERLKAGKIEAKARLCARGCEDPDDVATDM